MSNLGLGRLFVNASSTLARQLVAIVLGLLQSILLARVLGTEGNGIFAMIVLYSHLFHTFLNLGIGPASVYFVSGGFVSYRQARHSILRLWAVLSVLGIGVASVIVYGWSDQLLPGVPRQWLWLGIAAFPLQLLQSLLVSLLQAVQDFRRYNATVVIPAAMTLLIALVTVWVFRWGVPGATVAMILGYGIGLVITWRAADEHLDFGIQVPHAADYMKQVVGYGWKVHLSNILTFVNYRVDTFLVNLFLGPAITGVYVIAVQLAERTWIFSQTVSTVLLPRLSELRHDEANRKTLTPMISRWVLVISAVASLGLALLASPFIRWFYGEEYLPATQALLVLLPGIVMGSFSRVLANDIAARGKPELNMYLAGVVVVVNIVANLILIPMLGMVGASWATTIAYTINAVVRLAIYAHVSGNPWYRSIWMERGDWELLAKGISILRRRLPQWR